MKADTDVGPFLLAIETATAFGSVALFSADRLIASTEIRKQQSHARLLLPIIEQLLDNLDIKPASLAAIGVSRGPGSYTGLRVGVSTAKGLCYSLQKPLISYSTLETLADAQSDLAQQLDASIIPMIDARRMEVYCAQYNGKGEELSPIEAKIIDEQSFQQELEKCPVIFCGDGAEKCRGVLSAHPNAHVLGQVLPTAVDAGSRLWAKYQRKEFEDLITFEPFYLKNFRATKPKDPLRDRRK